MDPHHFGNPDPVPHQSDELDSDLHQFADVKPMRLFEHFFQG
jgi:hypothetical protein